MTFPTIQHIDDVLPSLEGRDEFAVKKGESITSIDYNYQLNDSFDDPIRRECRGIKFYTNSGLLAARPFHKFKNIGEAEDTHLSVLDFSGSHLVMEKLDGSMIHPIEVGKKIRFCTRAGLTDIAELAERYLTPNLLEFCDAFVKSDMTPIFEYVSPSNRIVLRYEEPQLVLLAARENETGVYWHFDSLKEISEDYGIPLVPQYDPIENPDDFIKEIRESENREGVVIRWPNGKMVKLKADAYVLQHRIKSDMAQEKNIFRAVLEDSIDDVLPLLDGEDQKDVEKYRTKVEKGLDWICQRLHGLDYKKERKEFALEDAKPLGQPLTAMAFEAYNGTAPRDAAHKILLKNCGSSNDLERVRWMFEGLNWPLKETEG